MTKTENSTKTPLVPPAGDPVLMQDWLCNGPQHHFRNYTFTPPFFSFIFYMVSYILGFKVKIRGFEFNIYKKSSGDIYVGLFSLEREKECLN